MSFRLFMLLFLPQLFLNTMLTAFPLIQLNVAFLGRIGFITHGQVTTARFLHWRNSFSFLSRWETPFCPMLACVHPSLCRNYFINLIVSNTITTRWGKTKEPCWVPGCPGAMSAVLSQEQGQSFFIFWTKTIELKDVFKFKRGLWIAFLLGSLCRAGLGCWILEELILGCVLLGSTRPRSTGRLMKDWVSLQGARHPPSYLGFSLFAPRFPHWKMGKPLPSLSLQRCHPRSRAMSWCCTPCNRISALSWNILMLIN